MVVSPSALEIIKYVIIKFFLLYTKKLFPRTLFLEVSLKVDKKTMCGKLKSRNVLKK